MYTESHSSLEVDTVDSGAMSIIALHGEPDELVQTVLALEVERVLARRPLVVAVDLRGLAIVNARAILALDAAGRRCQDRGHRFFLIRGEDQTRAIGALEDYFETVSEPDFPEDELRVGSL